MSSALAARQADRVASLAALMTSVGRESELEGLYVAARMPMLQVRRPKCRLLVTYHHGKLFAEGRDWKGAGLRVRFSSCGGLSFVSWYCMECSFELPRRRGVCQGLSHSCLKSSLLSYGVKYGSPIWIKFPSSECCRNCASCAGAVGWL